MSMIRHNTICIDLYIIIFQMLSNNWSKILLFPRLTKISFPCNPFYNNVIETGTTLFSSSQNIPSFIFAQGILQKYTPLFLIWDVTLFKSVTSQIIISIPFPLLLLWSILQWNRYLLLCGLRIPGYGFLLFPSVLPDMRMPQHKLPCPSCVLRILPLFSHHTALPVRKDEFPE